MLCSGSGVELHLRMQIGLIVQVSFFLLEWFSSRPAPVKVIINFIFFAIASSEDILQLLIASCVTASGYDLVTR